MSDCISLIDNRVDLAKVAQWVTVSQMTHILHTEPAKILSVAGGKLNIEPFCVPDMDCRIVGIVVYHCCKTGAIHSWDDEVIKHLHQEGTSTCVKLDCWDLNPPCSDPDADICWVPDACKRLEALRCAEMDWLINGRKTSWSFRDSSGATSYLTQARLQQLIGQAEVECSASMCGNSRSMTFSCP